MPFKTSVHLVLEDIGILLLSTSELKHFYLSKQLHEVFSKFGARQYVQEEINSTVGVPGFLSDRIK